MKKLWDKIKQISEIIGIVSLAVRVGRFVVGLAVALATMRWEDIINFFRGSNG